MLAFLLFPALGFWIIFAILAILCIVAVEMERNGWATVGLLSFIAGAHFLGAVDLVSWVQTNGLWLVGAIAAYFVMGALWALAKWYFFVKRIGRSYVDERVGNR